MNILTNAFLKFVRKRGYKLTSVAEEDKLNLDTIYRKYASFTMIPAHIYKFNLLICAKNMSNIEGDVVECGVWKGGMSAGIAELLGSNRKYYLFDSFEGLPEVKEIDGKSAKDWQTNTASDMYYDNCAADISFATKAMAMTNCNHQVVKGWFSDTLPGFNFPNKIALLRLDGDWYDSTMECLTNLFPKVVSKGIIIIDDYYAWDGCSKAVHDYLSQLKSSSRIYSLGGVCYIIKNESSLVS